MFGQVTNYETQVFINNREMQAVENATFSYSNSPTVSKFMGFGRCETLIGGVTQQTLSISRNLLHSDALLSLATSEATIEGSINYNGTSYGFANGRITDYAVSCAVGSYPKVTANITVFDEMVSGYDASGTIAKQPLIFPNQGSISVTSDNSTTDRVIGFDYSIRNTFKPIYRIGSQGVSEVVNFGKTEYTATVQIDVDEAFLQNAKNFLDLPMETRVVTFTIRANTSSGPIIQDLTIPNATLVGENLSASADGGVKLTLNYIGHS